MCMSHHYYTIGGNIHRQTEGGAIGSDLTGEEARLYMLLWDNKLVGKCKDLGILMDLYKRYVDDMTIVMRAIGKGWSYNRKKKILEYSDQQYLKDLSLTPTQKTAAVMVEISNAINGNIQVTLYSP